MDASDYQTIRQLFDDYLRMYASRDDRLTTYFSEDFSGFTGGGNFLVKDREEWVAITRQDFAQVKDPLRIELKDLAIQSLDDTIAVTTGFFTIHLPIKDHVLSRETARLVLIFRKESAGWKIAHSSISIPYYLVREGEVYPLKELVDRNQLLEELIAERTVQLSEANDNLQKTNEELAREIAEHKQVEADKEKLEAQNRQLQKAESLGRMAGAIAHHFNNQLGVVIGNLDLSMMELSEGSRLYTNITAAMKASNRAAEMSALMLTYLGQTPGKREPLDLSEACSQNLSILRAAMPRDVTLESDLPSPGPDISANANQIQQILINLVTNAWEAISESQGVIGLNVKIVSPAEIPAMHRFPLDWQPQDHAYACLEVTDTGCGIANTDIENLFDPFFSSKFTGRGLGLPVVLGIVRAHGGAIAVESEPGRGSAFRAFFSTAAGEILRQPAITTKAPEFEKGGTVLLVDDEEMVRDMSNDMLKRLGFTVLEAKDGIEAVELFREHQDEIRCVLCDLTMPRMNGWETLTALRHLAPDIPVILASGYDKAHVMAGDHPEQPQVFLGKPYKLKGLSDAIGHALAKKKQISDFGDRSLWRRTEGVNGHEPNKI
jgi:signal transduction histidine kinase/CheY-like chemotaxis protein